MQIIQSELIKSYANDMIKTLGPSVLCESGRLEGEKMSSIEIEQDSVLIELGLVHGSDIYLHKITLCPNTGIAIVSSETAGEWLGKILSGYILNSKDEVNGFDGVAQYDSSPTRQANKAYDMPPSARAEFIESVKLGYVGQALKDFETALAEHC